MKTIVYHHYRNYHTESVSGRADERGGGFRQYSFLESMGRRSEQKKNEHKVSPISAEAVCVGDRSNSFNEGMSVLVQEEMGIITSHCIKLI